MVAGECCAIVVVNIVRGEGVVFSTATTTIFIHRSIIIIQSVPSINLYYDYIIIPGLYQYVNKSFGVNTNPHSKQFFPKIRAPTFPRPRHECTNLYPSQPCNLYPTTSFRQPCNLYPPPTTPLPSHHIHECCIIRNPCS